MHRLTQPLLIASLVVFAASGLFASPEIDRQVATTQQAHNLEAWWGKDVVRTQVAIDFGGNRVVDGVFTFEAHGPRARYDRVDGVSIIFDGSTAWVTPASTEAPMGRFHVLTWPWFIMAPFKMQGEGIRLSELETRTVDGRDYRTLFQTFGEGLGDTPEDWYRFYIDPETGQIDLMSYIVTYGKDVDKANKKPSIIRYLDYASPGGPLVSTRYEFWYWDPEARAYVGDGPKGTGTVSEIEYIEDDGMLFAVPDDARELPLP